MDVHAVPAAAAEAKAGSQRPSMGATRCEPMDCDTADVCSMVDGVKALALRPA